MFDSFILLSSCEGKKNKKNTCVHTIHKQWSVHFSLLQCIKQYGCYGWYFLKLWKFGGFPPFQSIYSIDIPCNDLIKLENFVPYNTMWLEFWLNNIKTEKYQRCVYLKC